MSIRAYERSDLPLEEKLSSLGKRFPCLKGARGFDPWDPTVFHAWVSRQENGGSAYHAGHLLLNLSGDGPWEPFDILAARRVWTSDDRQTFIKWMKVWQ